MTNDHIEVISHYCKEIIFHSNKNQDRAHLREATCASDTLILYLNALQHVGIILVIKQILVKDKLEREKYTGVQRWESEIKARMMSRFPRMVKWTGIGIWTGTGLRWGAEVQGLLSIPEEEILRELFGFGVLFYNWI